MIRSLRFLRDGIRCLLHGKIEVPVLDATAIAVSILRGDFETASSIIFLPSATSASCSTNGRTKSPSPTLPGRWRCRWTDHRLETTDGSVAVPVGDVRPGDRIIVRTGGMIPLDGHVVAESDGGSGVHHRRGAGRAPRRAATSMPGRSWKRANARSSVDKSMGSGRYDRIVHMIEESEKLSRHRGAGLASGGQARAVQSRRDGAYLAADAQRQPRARRADGRFLVRAQALHADRGALQVLN